MDNSEKILNVLSRILANTGDRIVILQEELALTASAQPFPFTGLEDVDVVAIEFRVKAVGTPTDNSCIARFTMKQGDTPTLSHGMFVGDGDLYTITNNTNCRNAKLISTDVTNPVVNIIYYGSP